LVPATSPTPKTRSPLFLAALAVAIVSAATILGAYFFQYVLGLPPCPLCLQQRIPYYIAIPFGLLLAVGVLRDVPTKFIRGGLATLAVVMLIGVALGTYHAGVEWKMWAGPTDCTGPISDFGPTGSLLQQMQTTSVVRCDEAAWRFLGLSLAGYNALISAALAIIALAAVVVNQRQEKI
jgi:disulfide bond formation protein DsbB